MSRSNIINMCYTNELTVIPPKQEVQSVICKADSGASKTYFKPTDKHILENCKRIRHGPQVGLPNGLIIKTTKIGTLPLHNLLSESSRQANVLDGLSNSSLISIGQLCNDERCRSPGEALW